jgi:hypothetical protein
MAASATINIPAPNLQTATFRLEGTTSLICHAWSHKAKEQMLLKQMKRATPGKQAKDPQQDFEDSLYPMPDGHGYGFPALAFKAAMVRAGTLAELKMTMLRLVMHVPDGLVRIEGTPEPREDMVRLQGSTADIRYRGEFMPWAVELPVTFNANVISQEQIANLLMLAGFSVGVGEWRPERDGNHGMWRLA